MYLLPDQECSSIRAPFCSLRVVLQSIALHGSCCCPLDSHFHPMGHSSFSIRNGTCLQPSRPFHRREAKFCHPEAAFFLILFLINLISVLASVRPKKLNSKFKRLKSSYISLYPLPFFFLNWSFERY